MGKGISVFIITLNAAAKIEACLKSVVWADEIIVVDSGSTDGTREVLQKYGVRIMDRAFIDYAEQKNFALAQVRTEWALSIDADEVVPEEVQNEILRVIRQPGENSAFKIRRESFIFGRKFKYTGTQDDAPVRLMRSRKARFEQPIHEYVRVEGAVGKLQPALLHYTYDTVEDYLTRFNRYTSLEARRLNASGTSLSWMDFTLRPWGIFLRLYLLKQGFRDGFEGFLFSAFSGFYALIKYAKYRELKKSQNAV